MTLSKALIVKKEDMKKIKTYVLTVSQRFPSTHKRKGEYTEFISKICCAKDIDLPFPAYDPKLHTIRLNYPLWEKRIKEVKAGNAILSLRYWSGKPYRSKQVEFTVLDKDSGIGIQKLEDPSNFVFAPINGKTINWETIAKNDGLSFDDFCDWFKVRSKEPMAIIHFTEFRY